MTAAPGEGASIPWAFLAAVVEYIAAAAVDKRTAADSTRARK